MPQWVVRGLRLCSTDPVLTGQRGNQGDKPDDLLPKQGAKGKSVIDVFTYVLTDVV